MRHQLGTALRRSCTECTAFGWRRTRRHSMTRVAVAALVAVADACRGAEREDVARSRTIASSGDTRAGTARGASGSQTGQKPICPATGAWQLCSVMERLDRAGLAPRQDSGRVTEAPLSSRGVAIQVGRSELRIFIYADRAERERDQARLDTSKYVQPSEPLSMQVEPTLITSENLLAILRSRSDHQRERVSDALTAGPPQNPGTRG